MVINFFWQNVTSERFNKNKNASCIPGKGTGSVLVEVGDVTLVVHVQYLNGSVVLVDDVQVDGRAGTDLHRGVLLPVVVVVDFVLLYRNLA
jgi:hypothetical protein